MGGSRWWIRTPCLIFPGLYRPASCASTAPEITADEPWFLVYGHPWLLSVLCHDHPFEVVVEVESEILPAGDGSQKGATHVGQDVPTASDVHHVAIGRIKDHSPGLSPQFQLKKSLSLVQPGLQCHWRFCRLGRHQQAWKKSVHPQPKVDH